MKDELIKLMKDGIAIHATYTTTQHNRLLSPSYAAPENGFTSGVNNCYYDTAQYITFGHSSKTNGASCRFFFQMPSDYVDGEDMTLQITWSCDDTDNPNVIDYRVLGYYAGDGES